ncbi:MAG TPA: hypothetical protein VH987_09905, partial [Candidatus Limnocylindria bacterium]
MTLSQPHRIIPFVPKPSALAGLALVIAASWSMPTVAAARAPSGQTPSGQGAIGQAPPMQAQALTKPTLVKRRPCPESRFTCITLRVPRDHFATDGGGGTFDVTFAIQRATRTPRKGVFVTITGGPGTSGIASADSYTDALDPRIPRQYDIVFIDQRGVAASEPL